MPTDAVAAAMPLMLFFRATPLPLRRFRHVFFADAFSLDFRHLRHAMPLMIAFITATMRYDADAVTPMPLIFFFALMAKSFRYCFAFADADAAIAYFRCAEVLRFLRDADARRDCRLFSPAALMPPIALYSRRRLCLMPPTLCQLRHFRCYVSCLLFSLFLLTLMLAFALFSHSLYCHRAAFSLRYVFATSPRCRFILIAALRAMFFCRC